MIAIPPPMPQNYRSTPEAPKLSMPYLAQRAKAKPQRNTTSKKIKEITHFISFFFPLCCVAAVASPAALSTRIGPFWARTREKHLHRRRKLVAPSGSIYSVAAQAATPVHVRLKTPGDYDSAPPLPKKTKRSAHNGTQHASRPPHSSN